MCAALAALEECSILQERETETEWRNLEQSDDSFVKEGRGFSIVGRETMMVKFWIMALELLYKSELVVINSSEADAWVREPYADVAASLPERANWLCLVPCFILLVLNNS